MRILITGGNGDIARVINKNLSSIDYTITNVSRSELDVLNELEIEKYLKLYQFDILVHTAILGGRRTKEERMVCSSYGKTRDRKFKGVVKT